MLCFLRGIAKFAPKASASIQCKVFGQVHSKISQKRSSMEESYRVARQQNEVGTKYFFRDTIFSRKMLRFFFPKMFEPCGSEKIPQNSRQISRKMSLPRELASINSCIMMTLPITPKKFWGLNKRNFQVELHLLVLSS